MPRLHYIIVLFFAGCLMGFSQVSTGSPRFVVKGSIKGKENKTPISGVEVTTREGAYTLTNGLGEFKIQVAVGDELHRLHNTIYCTIRKKRK